LKVKGKKRKKVFLRELCESPRLCGESNPLRYRMLRKCTDIGLTQLPCEAMTCGNCKFALSHANVTRPPPKFVNICRKSLVCKELYLQTVFAAGWRNWVALRWYLMKLQNAESAFKRMIGLAYLRNCPKNIKFFTNAFPVFGHRIAVTLFTNKELQFPYTTRLELTFVNFAHRCKHPEFTFISWKGIRSIVSNCRKGSRCWN